MQRRRRAAAKASKKTHRDRGAFFLHIRRFRLRRWQLYRFSAAKFSVIGILTQGPHKYQHRAVDRERDEQDREYRDGLPAEPLAIEHRPCEPEQPGSDERCRCREKRASLFNRRFRGLQR